MEGLILKNFRCFGSPGDIPLAPLTILVGENSSGKSTLLAGYYYAHKFAKSFSTVDFNEEPFMMGGYEQIAQYKGGRGGRSASFTIGGLVRTPKKLLERNRDQPRLWDDKQLDDYIRIEADFVSQTSKVTLSDWQLFCGAYRLGSSLHDSNKQRQYKVQGPDGEAAFNTKTGFHWPLQMLAEKSFIDLVFSGDQSSSIRLESASSRPSHDTFVAIASLLQAVRIDTSKRTIPTAPIRTEPKRTYDLVKDTPQPTGGHIPVILANVYGGPTWDKLKEALDDFGKASGLFKSVKVRTLGRRQTGPFQIMVETGGPAFNLVDVGYGVSQILPIVVDMLQAANGSTFLLQQPEVHLHPRAQAALATLIGQIVLRRKHSFIIETHSDQLVDRVRMDVRDGKGLKPDDVLILFMERSKSSVVIHPIRLDSEGNLLDAPDSYRQFFMEEERRLLGV